jgi:4-hydroxybenzoate polyprenyltransferase
MPAPAVEPSLHASDRALDDRSAADPADGRVDIRTDGWVDRRLPPSLRPYARLARLDRPIGTWLLLIPCWWSVALAARITSDPLAAPGGWPDPLLMILFGVGAVVMRGAGCTVNDIVDREYDGRVARTRTRPIPSGQVTVRQALVFLAAQLLVGLAVLLMLDETAIWLGVASLSLVVTYPFMKRITWWPQFVLGLAFNWGALMGWAAVRGTVDLPAIVLYVAGIAWTLGYDTIYAHQDKDDDERIGLKSTALLFRERTKWWLWGFYAVAISGIGAAGILAGLGTTFQLPFVIAAGHLVWQVLTLKIDDPADCMRKFRSNRDFGLIVLAGIVGARVLG